MYILHVGHLKAQQNFEMYENSPRNRIFQRVWLFRNKMSLQVLHVFVWDSLTSRKGFEDNALVDGLI